MNKDNTKDALGAMLASKGFKSEHFKILSLGSKKSARTTKARNSFNANRCFYCENQKHTRNSCFKLHGYPQWWAEFQSKKKNALLG